MGLLMLSVGFEWEGRLGRLERELQNGDARRRREVVRRMAAYPADEVQRPLLQALEDPEVAVRLEAARTSGEVGLEAAVPVLREWMEAPDADIRAAAARALGGIGDPRPVGSLVRALGDSAAEVRRAAIQALARLGTDEEIGRTVAVPLLARLDDDDAEVRIAAAEALASMGDVRAVVPLVGRARDSAPEVRVAVYRALGELADRRAAAALIQSLRDDDENARLAAIAALGRMRASSATPALGELAADRDARVAQAAVVALGRMTDDPDALDGLVGALARADTRRIAEELLVQRGDDALTLELARRLPNASNSVEAEGLTSVVEARLKRSANAEAAAPLLEALERGIGPETAVLRALATTGDPEVLVPILETLDPEAPVPTRAALAALERYFELHESDGRAADPLLAILGEVPADERVRVVRLLGHSGAGRALRALEPLLEHESAELRRAAVEAIGKIGPGGARALMPLLDSDDARIRFEAARNVGSAADATTVDALLERLGQREPADRHALLEALGPALARAVPENDGERAEKAAAILGQIAHDRDERLAARALEALARWGAKAPLLALAAEGTTRRGAQARLALGRTAPNEASLALLREHAADGDWASTLALGEVGSAADTDRLLTVAAEGSWPASTTAAFALARLGRRGELGDDAAPRLCALARARRAPHLRANVVIALAAIGGRCESGEPSTHVHPRSWLTRAHAPVVRGAAARWLAASYPDQADLVLGDCMEDALSPDVRAACADPRMPPLEDTADVYAYAVDGRTLLRDTVVALRLADGSSFVVRTDANAHLRLENVPAGPLKLDDPLASPLEP